MGPAPLKLPTPLPLPPPRPLRLGLLLSDELIATGREEEEREEGTISAHRCKHERSDAHVELVPSHCSLLLFYFSLLQLSVYVRVEQYCSFVRG